MSNEKERVGSILSFGYCSAFLDLKINPLYLLRRDVFAGLPLIQHFSCFDGKAVINFSECILI